MTAPHNDKPAPLDDQRRFWNSWNANNRTGDWKLPAVNARQAETVRQWLVALGRRNLDILEVGCGSGWLCEQLVEFGRVTGTDLANEVLPPDRQSPGGVTYIAGDFFQLALPQSAYDVIVSLEMLAHVDDQPAYLAKITSMLRPGGLLMLATQNKFVLERWSGVAPKGAGQIRKWVDASALRKLVGTQLRIEALTSLFPVGDRGILRLVNSSKMDRMVSVVASRERIDAIKERLLLGHTLMVLARKPVQRAGN